MMKLLVQPEDGVAPLLEALEGALRAQIDILAKELQALKRRLEG